MQEVPTPSPPSTSETEAQLSGHERLRPPNRNLPASFQSAASPELGGEVRILAVSCQEDRETLMAHSDWLELRVPQGRLVVRTGRAQHLQNISELWK